MRSPDERRNSEGEDMGEFKFSLPLHFQVNTPKPRSRKDKMRFNPGLNQIFAKQGLRLDGRELRSLHAGRAKGIETLEGILSKTPIAKDLAPGERKELAADLADALMNMSLQGQLSREAPTALDRNRKRDENIQHVMFGSVVKDFPIQAKLTIHLPVSWL
jgi:hypothetical protein